MAENHSSDSEHGTISGYTRSPSGLGNPTTIPERSCSVASGNQDSLFSGIINIGGDKSILRWDEDLVVAWLKEIGYEQYEMNFREHAISSGQLLVDLEESHLREMGVSKIGHRLDIMEGLHQLRKDAGLSSKERLIDTNTLLKQLDAIRFERTLTLYPKRIIIIRPGESQGKVDPELYSHVPDSRLELTPNGRHQAYAAGVKLKQLIGSESVTFYVSPFTRSRQTYDQIRMSFHDEQVLHYREDPRIREQEWGNFQDPTKMDEIMKERRKIGSFYYRFPTGESGSDVYDRVSTFLETMYRDMEKGGCGQNTIIVSHGLFCRLFLTRYYHWSVEKFHKLWNFENCQFAIMELQSNGGYKLVTELKSDP